MSFTDQGTSMQAAFCIKLFLAHEPSVTIARMGNDAALAGHYYLEPAGAWLRGEGFGDPNRSDEDLVQDALRAGHDVHRFKRSSVLPRVQKVLGILRGLSPSSLLDVASTTC